MSLFIGVLVLHCGPQRGQARSVERIDAALAQATRYIVSHQSSDGSWKSKTYGCFKEGPALTAYILNGLLFFPDPTGQNVTAFRKGVDYLVNMVEEDGSIRTGLFGLTFPVYTAASAARVVVMENSTPQKQRAQKSWLAYLRTRQFTKSLGWTLDDPDYGGWSYFHGIPHKSPKSSLEDTLLRSNLSSTLFALGALRAAHVPHNDPAWRDALVFVTRCQNFSEDPNQADPLFDDGGFFFSPENPVQNKAGAGPQVRFGRQRFYSYGSATCDGIRAMLLCGLGPDHPRVIAARRWLENNFSAETQPGHFIEQREVLRDATYYYYVWSVAHALSRLNLTDLDTPQGKIHWAAELAEELLQRQRPDGSWENPYTDAKEDDPLVATPFAAAALAFCRAALSTNSE